MSANNNCIFMGRLVKDMEMHGDGTSKVAKNSLAIDRQFKKDGQPSADFVNIVAFGKIAEFCEKYLHKGSKVLVRCHVQTGSYEKEGRKIYTTDFVVDDITFAESKAGAQQNAGADLPEMPNDLPTSDGVQSSIGDFMNLSDGLEDELPFK